MNKEIVIREKEDSIWVLFNTYVRIELEHMKVYKNNINYECCDPQEGKISLSDRFQVKNNRCPWCLKKIPDRVLFIYKLLNL